MNTPPGKKISIFRTLQRAIRLKIEEDLANDSVNLVPFGLLKWVGISTLMLIILFVIFYGTIRLIFG